MAGVLDDAHSSTTVAAPDESEAQEIVAVGAVAHVIRRAFHQFYSDVAPHAQSADDVALGGEQLVPTATNATASATLSVPSATNSTTDALDNLEHTGGTSTDVADAAAAERPPPVNAFVLAGDARKAQIERERRRKHEDASALLRFLDARHREAKAADDAIAQALSAKGLVVKAQIPMGPSNLRLDAREIAHFGPFADDLVHATQLVHEYHARRLQRSGNGPDAVARKRAAAPGITPEPLGYLDATDSSSIRTHATLTIHESHIEHVKTHHQSSNASSSSTSGSGGGGGGSGIRKALASGSMPDRSIDASGLQSTDEDSSRVSPLLSPSQLEGSGSSAAAGAKTSVSSSSASGSASEARMSAGETRNNMAILHRMQTKLDFLRNPRYASSDRESVASSVGAVSDSPGGTASPSSLCFVAVPSPVEFTDYDTGGVYEQLVYVRNTSHLSRRLRVLPPATIYFSIAEIVFPDASGLVAPGMHAQLRLRFAPDSRADYRDAIRVAHECSGSDGASRTEFPIPLVARRAPPELSIPLVLHAQNTLVGTSSVTRLQCHNSGGRARFWLMTEADWARHESSAALFLQREVSSASLTESPSGGDGATRVLTVALGAFTLSPSEVELGTGESVEFALQYVPSCVGEQRSKFVMVCDNCLVRVFQVVGRGCQVELSVSSVNDKPVDASVTHMGVVDQLCFDPLAVRARATQRFVVANDTPITLRFAWRIEPTQGSSRTVVGTGPTAALPAPFKIHPSSGVIALNAVMEFAVAFEPPQARVYACTATLLVHDIPPCSVPGPEQRALLLRTFERIQASLHNVALATVPCMRVQLDGTGVLGSFSIEPPYWNFCSSDAVSTSGATSNQQPEQSEQQQHLLHKHVTYTARVRLHNDTAAPVAFAIDTARVQQRHAAAQPPLSTSGATALYAASGNEAGAAFELAVTPAAGELAPHTHEMIAVTFTPHRVGAFSLALPCCIPTHSSHGDGDDSSNRASSAVRWLLLEGCVARGAVTIVSPEVDFGLVLVSASAEAALTLRNTASVAADWHLVHVEAVTAAVSAGAPSAGTDTASVAGVVQQRRTSDAGALSLSPASMLLLSANQREAPLHRSGSKNSIVSRRSVSSNASSGDGGGNDTSRRSSSLFFTARDVLPRATVIFVPESGTLAAGETRTVKVLCLAGSLPERLRASFRCELSPERTFADGASLVSTTAAATAAMSACVSARAEIQSPNVFLAPSRLQLGTTYIGVAVHRTLQLVNVSNLEASFKFVEPQGASRAYAVDFAPRTGTIHSKETLAVVLTYTPRQAGRTTVLLACTVRGLAAPLGLEVATNQKGLVLSYELLPATTATTSTSTSTSSTGVGVGIGAAPALALPKSPKEIALERGISIADCDLEPESTVIPKLLFGDAIALGTRRTLHVLIRNFSGIEAVIDLEAKKFPAQRAHGDDHAGSSSAPSPAQLLHSGQSTSSPLAKSRAKRVTSSEPTAPGSPATGTTRSSKAATSTSPSSTSSLASPAASGRKKPLLTDAHEHPSRFQSERGRDYVRQCTEDVEDRYTLRHGRGVAFELRPSRVRIPPWEQRVATVVCFNNMPGSYTDDIVSRAVSAPPVFLHAQATVVGSPLTLDRNCVGLYYPKRQHPGRADASTSVNGPPLHSLEQPTFHFGQLCTRAAPLTRALRVVNRGPRHARIKWKLVERGRENQLVTLSLRLDFACRVQLRIAACDDNSVTFPFAVEPAHAVVAPFATVAFQVTYTPSATVGAARALLLADAYWYDTETATPASESSEQLHIEQHPSTSGSNSSSGEPASGGTDSRCESSTNKRAATKDLHHATAPSSSHIAAAAAAGKAFVAVRAANSLSRRVPPGPTALGGALMNTTPSHVSTKCLRVLLSADVVEPELFLDRSTNALGGDNRSSSSTQQAPLSPSLALAQPSRSLQTHTIPAGYHIKFTTWSTIAATARDTSHVFHRQELFLVNHLSARLTFRLESVGPFTVHRADSIAPKHPLSSAELPPAHRRAQGESFMFTLPPQMSVRIDLRFDPTRLEPVAAAAAAPAVPSSMPALTPLPALSGGTSAVSPSRRLSAAQPRKAPHSPPLPLSLESQRLKTLVEGQLLVRFTNRSVQTVRLVTELLRPLVVVSPSVHFFGHVHLSQTRAVVLRLANPTPVPAAFTITPVPAPVPLSKAQRQEFALHHAQYVDDPSVFAFSTRQGVVVGPTTTLRSAGGALPTVDSMRDLGSHHLVFEPVAVRVVFKAPAVRRRYRSRFRFVVTHGVDFDIVLEGEGHLEEHNVADQSRSLVRTRALEHSDRIFTKILQ